MKFVLVLAAALGYALATIGMKLFSITWSMAAVALLFLGFAVATAAEVVLMRGVHLGVLYLTIMALETLAILAYAISIGEGLSPVQMLGGAFVLAGLAVISA